MSEDHNTYKGLLSYYIMEITNTEREEKEVLKVLKHKLKLLATAPNLDYKMVLEVKQKVLFCEESKLMMVDDKFGYGWISFEDMADFARKRDFEFIQIVEVVRNE